LSFDICFDVKMGAKNNAVSPGWLQEKPYINAGARAIINKRELAVSA
jgi:hypothetical protein